MKTKLLIALVVSSIVITSCTTTERSKENEFESAVRMSDIPKIEKLLKEGMNIDSKIINDKTALIIASESGDDLVVKELISKGANLEVGTKISGSTALFFVLDENNQSTLKLLLDSGANINAQDIEKRTPVMIACHLGKYEVVRTLIEYKAEINKVDISGETALGYALYENDRFKKSLVDDSVSDTDKKEAELKLKEYDKIVTFLKSKGAKTAAELKPTPDEKK